MKSLIVLILMTLAFAMCAAASMTLPQQDEAAAAVLGDADRPELTGEMIEEFTDSVSTVLGVTLSQEQGDELHGLIMRTWRLRDEQGIDMVMESVDGWRAMRELPPRGRAALARQLRPQAIAQIRRGGGDIEKWMLSIHENATAGAGARTATAAAE